jgi:hypothetical protein
VSDTPNRPSVKDQGGIVAPQPVPMAFTVSVLRIDETQQAVTLVFYSPTGQHVSFLSADGADELARQLQEHAATSRTGLIVAGAMSGLTDKAKP